MVYGYRDNAYFFLKIKAAFPVKRDEPKKPRERRLFCRAVSGVSVQFFAVSSQSPLNGRFMFSIASMMSWCTIFRSGYRRSAAVALQQQLDGVGAHARQDAIVGNRRTAALNVAQHGGAGFTLGFLLDVARQLIDVADVLGDRHDGVFYPWRYRP